MTCFLSLKQDWFFFGMCQLFNRICKHAQRELCQALIKLCQQCCLRLNAKDRLSQAGNASATYWVGGSIK